MRVGSPGLKFNNKEHGLYILRRNVLSFVAFTGQQYASKDLLSSVIKELKDTSSSAHKSYKCRKCRFVAK